MTPRSVRVLLTLTASAVAVLLPSASFANGDEGAATRIVVKLDPGVMSAASSGTGGRVVEQVDATTFVVEVPNADGAAAAAAIEGRTGVSYAEPDFVWQTARTPNDPCLSTSCPAGGGPQYALAKVAAPTAWDVTTGEPQVKIAVIDSGVDVGHPELSGKITTGPNYSTVNNDVDEYGHGTHVAGVIGASTDNGTGVAGMNWNASMVSVKVLDQDGRGFTTAVARALIWAADNGVRIANLSLEGSSYSTTVANAVSYAESRGVLVVAAAGNSAGSTPVYPAALPGVLSVGSTDENDNLSSFSNRGPWVDTLAPGSNIFSTYPRNLGTPYAYESGTSMAAPLVSGIASLLWSQRPYLSAEGVMQRITDTVDQVAGSGTFTASGRVNAGRALSNLGDGYRFAAADGGVFSFGTSFQGSAAASALNQPVVTMASSGTGDGYWLFARDGGVFSFGDAAFYGSTGGTKINQPIVAALPTKSGRGYWLIAADGGVFSFGDATFFGSTGATKLNSPIVTAVASPTGAGYWLIAADGGVFSFGDASFFGSTGAIALNRSIVAAGRSHIGNGYWLIASDGGVFAFGDAAFYGSTGATRLNQPIVSMAPSGSGYGYRLVASDGGVFAFGDASFQGSTGGTRLNSPIVASIGN